MNNLNPEKFELEYSTVWSFPKRGNWATHKSDYRGNWALQIPRNIILRYSKEGDTVLDPMVGSGTTLIECKLLGRNGIGYDINPSAVKLAKGRLDFNTEHKENLKFSIEVGDARTIKHLSDNSIDFIATHPPYTDIIKYSDGKIEGDLSNIHNIDEFCDEIEKVAKECYRVLKSNSYCTILIGDTRRKGMFTVISYKVMERFIKIGFLLKEDIIKVQHNCATTPFWKNQSKKYGFHLIMHEHLFVFKKI
ncbi:MAG: hypothetical protein A2252_05955 [Elusimicrobia bacterium RIFOXYA2_FULL_39_19]|nr:MAG: hypothetical protein A2252_05955 [Elusimicrobia bacterium RIFOXYA2_FULL_39_19]